MDPKDGIIKSEVSNLEKPVPIEKNYNIQVVKETFEKVININNIE